MTPPPVDPANEHIFHQYTIRAERRDALLAHLKARGHRHTVYYPLRAAPPALLRVPRRTGAARCR